VGDVVTNAVIYAELAIGFRSVDALDRYLTRLDVVVAEIPRPALHLAGLVFQAYRRRGGVKTGVLPDFFIGAHAMVLDCPILTRDIRRYQTYFPMVELIAPSH
jgi:predicted nucleic acid-binding protein